MRNFNWAEEAEKLWDKNADSWNSRSKDMWEKGSRKEIIPFLQQHLKMNVHVCDLGCGDGYGSLKLAQAGFQVTGVDVSEDMIDKAKIVNAENHAVFVKADIASLPFEDGEFDAVMAINSLEWTESPLQVIKEMKRIIKRGGRACVGILGPTAGPRANSFRRLYGEKVVCNTMMPWEFEQLAGENGLEKMAELGVYKKESEQLAIGSLTTQMKQALSFMWVFVFQINE